MRVILGRMYAFLKIAVMLVIKHPRQVNLLDMFRYFPDWWSSFTIGRSPLGDKRPWLAFSAIHHLENILQKHMRVYEYGSGGSTLIFSERVREVVSTEHNRDWHSKVLQSISKNNIRNCNLRLYDTGAQRSMHRQDLADPDAYISSDGNYSGLSFREYASSIDSYPDEYFDVVLIDGRSRPSCFKHAERKLKTGGYLILDNAENPAYAYIHKTARGKKWKKFDYIGLFPYIYHYSETCIWQKLED